MYAKTHTVGAAILAGLCLVAPLAGAENIGSFQPYAIHGEGNEFPLVVVVSLGDDSDPAPFLVEERGSAQPVGEYDTTTHTWTGKLVCVVPDPILGDCSGMVGALRLN